MDEMILSCGAVLTPQKRIANAKGDIFHALKSTDVSYCGFGEAYFSTVLSGVTKGWKRHSRMTLNLIVPVGTIRFDMVGVDGLTKDSVELGEANYSRLTVPPGIWLAFTGIGRELNLLLNLASIPHDPAEAETVSLEEFKL